MMRMRDETGASLVEIVIAIVLLGVVVSALMAGLTTAARSSKSHRDLTTADTVMRSYAEATKEAVRSQCNGAATYTVAHTPAPGFTASGASGNCPSPSSPETLTLMVNGPNGSTTMQIVVRSR